MKTFKHTTTLFALVIVSIGLTVGLLGQSNITAQAATPNQTGEWLTRLTTSNQPLGQRIAMASENNGWFMAFSGNLAYLANYDGFNWSVFNTVGHSQEIVAADIKMVSDTDGWIVLGGWLGATPAQSSIYRWNGTSWDFFTTITDPNAIQLSSLDALGANNVWVLGTGNFWSSLYHWDGNTWSFAGKAAGGVWAGTALDMLSANDGWAVGFDGAIAHWDGNDLIQVPSSTSSNLNAIAMVNSNIGWAVGDGGAIQTWDGGAWTSYLSPTSAKLLSIDMVSASEGWIVGENVILQWDGTEWSNYTPPSPDTFNDIDMISAQDGWIVGNGSLLQYQTSEPQLVMNYSSGAPGSYFNVLGQNFPANSTAQIIVNGRSLGTVPVGSTGSFALTLTTANADEGTYILTASVNPSASKQFILDSAEPIRPAADPVDTFDVPAGVAFTKFVYVPVVIR